MRADLHRSDASGPVPNKHRHAPFAPRTDFEHIEKVDMAKYVPEDCEPRLARAWAATVWPHLNSGSGLAAFDQIGEALRPGHRPRA